MAALSLPTQNHPIAGTQTIDKVWYEFLTRLAARVSADDAAAQAEIDALRAQVEGGDSTVLRISENLSDVADVSEAQGNIGMAWVRVSAGSAASDVSEIDIPLVGAYRAFDLLIHEIVVSGPPVAVNLRLSLDGGTTYEAAAYNYATRQLSDTAALTTISSSSAAQMFLGNAGSVAAEGVSFSVRLHMTADHYPRAEVSGYGVIGGQGYHYKGGGALESTGVPTHARILLASGTITSCTWTLLGLR